MPFRGIILYLRINFGSKLDFNMQLNYIYRIIYFEWIWVLQTVIFIFVKFHREKITFNWSFVYIFRNACSSYLISDLGSSSVCVSGSECNGFRVKSIFKPLSNIQQGQNDRSDTDLCPSPSPPPSPMINFVQIEISLGWIFHPIKTDWSISCMWNMEAEKAVKLKCKKGLATIIYIFFWGFDVSNWLT